MMVFATVLLSPHLYTYDLTILLLPMLMVGAVAMQHYHQSNCRLLIWALVLLFAFTGLSELIAAKTAVQLSVPLLVAIMAMTLKQRARLTVSPMEMVCVS